MPQVRHRYSPEKDLDKLVSFGVYSVKSPVNGPSGVTDWANVIVVPTNGEQRLRRPDVSSRTGGVIDSCGKGGGDWDIWKVLKREPV